MIKLIGLCLREGALGIPGGGNQLVECDAEGFEALS
jgi:hypothetical protein